MTKIFYDTEFLENGKTIELISIGMVAENLDCIYYINSEAPWRDIIRHDWLRNNVMPYINFNDPRIWLTKSGIAIEVINFIRSIPDPELWAWYGAYDNVVLCQQYGPMSGIPNGIPYWTNDLRQEYHRLKIDPKIHEDNNRAEHHALDDARDVMRRYRLLLREDS